MQHIEDILITKTLGKVFRSWKTSLMKLREENFFIKRKQEKIIKKFRFVRKFCLFVKKMLVERCFKELRENCRDKIKEKILKKEKEKMMSKVSKWLEEFEGKNS